MRRTGLHHTQLAKATCGTIRLKLLKIGALVRVSVRRIKVAMASGCPAADAWGRAAVGGDDAAARRRAKVDANIAWWLMIVGLAMVVIQVAIYARA